MGLRPVIARLPCKTEGCFQASCEIIFSFLTSVRPSSQWAKETHWGAGDGRSRETCISLFSNFISFNFYSRICIYVFVSVLTIVLDTNNRENPKSSVLGGSLRVGFSPDGPCKQGPLHFNGASMSVPGDGASEFHSRVS